MLRWCVLLLSKQGIHQFGFVQWFQPKWGRRLLRVTKSEKYNASHFLSLSRKPLALICIITTLRHFWWIIYIHVVNSFFSASKCHHIFIPTGPTFIISPWLTSCHSFSILSPTLTCLASFSYEFHTINSIFYFCS